MYATSLIVLKNEIWKWCKERYHGEKRSICLSPIQTIKQLAKSVVTKYCHYRTSYLPLSNHVILPLSPVIV